MWELRKIDVLSLAKIYAVIMAIIGFVVGIITAIIGLAIGTLVSGLPGAAGIMPFGLLGVFSVLAIIIFPIIYGVIGFIAGAISAFLYNIVAGWTGGVMLDLQKGSFWARIPRPPKKKRKWINRIKTK